MSIVDSSSETEGEVRLPSNSHALHRLATVRRLQGISRRVVARRMCIEVSEVSRQEDETADLPLSKLYEWQRVLDVPIAELLIESQDTLAKPLMERAQLVRLMKTALAIFEQAGEDTVRLMAQTLVDQLIEIMPELRGVSAWHTVGKRRRLSELGITAQRPIGEDVFIDHYE